MKQVTIKDVLDAGGEIFGLPVLMVGSSKSSNKGICASSDIDDEGEVCIEIPSSVESDVDYALPSEFEVYADGIRVLEIDGRLYRVTGHKLSGIHYSGDCHINASPPEPTYIIRAVYEPIIPDKPKTTCKTCGQEIKENKDA